MRLDRSIAAEAGVMRKPDAFGIDQRRALLQRFLAPPPLPIELEVGQLSAAVDARGLERFTLDRYCRATLIVSDHDDIGQVIFLCGVGVANPAEPAKKILRFDGHHARIAQLDRALGL